MSLHPDETRRNEPESLVNESKYHTLPRIYVGASAGNTEEGALPSATTTTLHPKAQITLTPDQAHYVTKVMRLGRPRSTQKKKKAPPALLRLFNGLDGEWLAQIHIHTPTPTDQQRPRRNTRKSSSAPVVVAECLSLLHSQQHSNDEPWLYFAPLKKARNKLLLEKCTELGVGRLVPLSTERCDSNNWNDYCRNLGKWQVVTVEAAEQCERLTLPDVVTTTMWEDNQDDKEASLREPPLLDVSRLLEDWKTRHQDGDGKEGITKQPRHLLICRERNKEGCLPVLQVLQEIHLRAPAVSKVAFVVGPEGGWSDAEQVLMDEYGDDCEWIHSVSLGNLVLRAETAAIMALGSYMLFTDCRQSE